MDHGVFRCISCLWHYCVYSVQNGESTLEQTTSFSSSDGCVLLVYMSAIIDALPVDESVVAFIVSIFLFSAHGHLEF